MSAAGTELHPAIQQRIHLRGKFYFGTLEYTFTYFYAGIHVADISSGTDVVVWITVAGVVDIAVFIPAS